MTTDRRRRVYLLSPQQLSPETIAVAFAKTSRSPESFDQIAAELTDARSAAFHEKWVVGYGHASVAEHAVLHLAFENVSRLAIECIESNRLASYTEKSTRYQMWSAGDYHLPEEARGGPYESVVRTACEQLFRAYLDSLEPVRRVVQARTPRRQGESDERWDGRIRARYVDVCRYLLPAAALANVGMTVNARALEHAVRKMLSHQLAEVRSVGGEAKAAALAEVPTLLKYADPTPYWQQLDRDLPGLAEGPAQPAAGEPVRLLDAMPGLEETVLAASLYPHGQAGFEGGIERVRRMDPAGRAALWRTLMEGRGAHEAPIRSLEHGALVFEVVLDQGAYFELKRHRMMSLTPQGLTTRLGYALPLLIQEAGIEPAYRQAMAAAAEAYEALAGWNRQVAAYVVPNAYRRRALITMNLRQAFHFCELRAAANAHFAIRRIALRMAEVLGEIAPGLAAYLRLPEGADRRALEREHFVEA